MVESNDISDSKMSENKVENLKRQKMINYRNMLKIANYKIMTYFIA